MVKNFFLVGSPITVEKRTNPSREEVDALHNLYLLRLTELFDVHKQEHSDYPDATLVFV